MMDDMNSPKITLAYGKYIKPPYPSLSLTLSLTHIANWHRPILASSKHFNLWLERGVGWGEEGSKPD